MKELQGQLAGLEQEIRAAAMKRVHGFEEDARIAASQVKSLQQAVASAGQDRHFERRRSGQAARTRDRRQDRARAARILSHQISRGDRPQRRQRGARQRPHHRLRADAGDAELSEDRADLAAGAAGGAVRQPRAGGRPDPAQPTAPSLRRGPPQRRPRAPSANRRLPFGIDPPMPRPRRARRAARGERSASGTPGPRRWRPSSTGSPTPARARACR